MDLQTLQSEVIENGFKTGDTAQITKWLNAAAAQLWALESWPFKRGQTAVSVTAGSSAVSSVPADFLVVHGLWDEDGERLTYVHPEAFNSLYYASTNRGRPADYTVDYTGLDGNTARAIMVGPIADTTSATYRLLYERAFGHYHQGADFVMGDMADATDTPALPPDTHYVLVYWARMIGKGLRADPTAAIESQLRDEAIQAMRAAYLTEQVGEVGQWGSYRPEAMWAGWR